MGRIIAGQIRGMGLAAKLSLVMVLTLLISTFMYQGWYKPSQAKAAVRTYYMTFSSGTAFSLPSGTTTNTSCPTANDTYMGTTPAVGILNDADSTTCVPVSNRDIEYNAANTFTLFYNGAGYTQAMNVTGTTVTIRARANSTASVTITPRLFYTAPGGTRTYFTGSTAGKTLTGETRTMLTYSLTGQSATNIPAGSKLGIQFTMSAASRVCVNDYTGSTDELVVEETPAVVSSNANLSGLVLSAGSLTPSFSSSTTSYTASVANAVTSITVTPTEEDTTATTTVNGAAVNSGSASGPIALAVGANTITTVVTAQNGTSKTYTVVVSRAPATPVSANLTALSLSSGSLSPIFAGSTIYYTSTVSNATSSITVTPTAEDSAAIIRVNGIAVTSGTASTPFSLVVGANGFNVTVTASDGLSTKNYTIVVTRQPVGSNIANLSGLGLSSGLLSPNFAATTVYYTATVSNSIATITVTPTAEDGAATITINGIAVASGAASVPFTLVVGNNSLNVLVTAPDGSNIKTYTIIVTREPQISNNANLGNMTLSSGFLAPAFNSSTTSYTAAVANAVSTITVTPTAESAYAGIRVNGITVTSGATSIPFALAVGPNSLNVVVTAQDGTTTKSYSIIVTRAIPPSTNANLANLVLSSGTLSPTFNSSTSNYSATVANAVSTMTVTPTVQDATAIIKVNNIAVTSGTASVPFALTVGANSLNVVVTAQDGTTIKTYTVVVTRTAPISTNPNLGGLTVSSAVLSPTFSSSTANYSATVANTVTMVTVTPTAQDANATIKVNGIAVANGTASVPFALALGANSLYVVVTAQDGITFRNYSIVITRETVKSTNANLNNLTISAGTMNPAFSSTTTNYSATVANAVSTITMTPTAQDANATIQVNGVSVASGSTSNPFALAYGANSFQIVATAQDGFTSKAYWIQVTREATVTNSTTPAPLIFSGVTGSAINVTAPFSGDSNGNNSCVIRWGTSLNNYSNILATNKVGSAYAASITSGLTMGATYYFQATFTDPDGTSSNTVAGSQATANNTAGNPLMHNGANLNSTYDNGAWGLTFTCNTCHAKTTTNIKKITTSIPATIGTALVKPVKFRSLTTMGNDGDQHTTSDRICEVCHTQTTVHRYNTSGQSELNHMGANSKDCTDCHSHGKGFGASCNACHGYPPIAASLGQDGLANPATGILPSGQSGAHATHVVDKEMTCEGCHQGYTSNPMGNRALELGFKLDSATVNGFGGNIASGSFSGKTPAAPYTGIISSFAGTTVTTSSNGTNSCSVYCHGAWPTTSGGAVTAPVWIGSLAGTGCQACHGASATTPPSPAIATGAHGRHAGNGPGGLAKSCSNCHGDVTDPFHLDGRVRWDFTGLGGDTSYALPGSAAQKSGYRTGPAQSGTYGTCQMVYCHSGVQNPVNGSVEGINYKTPQWGGGSFGCDGCHASMSGTNVSGSHAKHAVSLALGCSTCHNNAGQGTLLHANSTIEISFGGPAAGGYYSQGSSMPGNGYGSCSNIYCHSDGRTFTNPYGQNVPPTWGNGPVACNTCHSGGVGGSNQGPTYTGGKANSHPKHRFTCEKCHAATTNGTGTIISEALHGNKSYNLQNGGTVSFTVSLQGTPTTPTQCSSISCHGNGNATWGQILSCGSCHSNMATNIGTGSHPRHASRYSLACSACHGSGYTALEVTSETHGDTSVNMNFTGTATGTAYSKGDSFSPNGTYGTCSASYCHSEGKSFTAPFVQRTVMTWGGGTSCFSCHNGVPSYVGGKANSHPKHAFSCEKCHNNVYDANSGAIGNPALHANQKYDLEGGNGASFTVLVQGTPSSPSQCGNVSCHGGNSATWGGSSLSCGGCHGAATDRDNFVFNDGITAQINSTEWTAKGHGATFGSTSVAEACLYCHNNSVGHGDSANYFRLANTTNGSWGLNGACMICHADGSTGFNGKNSNKKIGSYHYGEKHGGTAGGRWCWDCHDPHGDSNIKMIGATMAKSSASDGRPLTITAVTFTANSIGSDFAGASTKLCNTCHTNTNHYTASSSDGHNLASRCTQCHSHNASTVNGAFAGGDCLGCHSVAQGKRAPVIGHLRGNSHHIQGVTLTSAHCYQCHWEATSTGSINDTYHPGIPDGAVNLVVFTGTTRPESYVANSTAVEYSADGTRTQAVKINQHCMGCHNDTGKTMALPGPFKDGKLPNSYSWDGASIAAKYGDTGTTPWGKYSGTDITPKNTVTKAFSAHGNAIGNAGGWNTSETWGNTRGGTTVDRNVYCIDCHNSHGSNVVGTTTSYTVTGTINGGMLKDTTTGQGGYSATYKPVAGGSVTDKNAFNAGAALCFDCHLTQTANATKPWGWSSTYGATAAILGYWDTPNFGPGTFPSTTRYTYKTSNHMGGHFGASIPLSGTTTNMISGLCTPCHDPHGINPANTNRNFMVPMLKGTWLTSVYKEDVATSDNQAYLGREDDEGPNPSTSYAAAIKSYKIDQNTLGATSSISETDAQFAGLCLSCHAKTSLTGAGSTWKSKDRIHQSVKGWKTSGTIKHNYTCSKCHAPHNARLPRLMVTNCLDSRHRGRVTNQTNPVTSGSNRGEDGSGSGKKPGVYTADGTSPNLYGGRTCHDANDSNQMWNNVTPWAR